MPSGGGGGGAAAPAAGGAPAAAAAEEKKEEKVEEKVCVLRVFVSPFLLMDVAVPRRSPTTIWASVFSIKRICSVCTQYYLCCGVALS